MKSALLSRPGAVAELENSTVAWHYGDPLGEQRRLAGDGAVVDRGDRDVISVTGPERLSWLHNVTTQHLPGLGDAQGTQLMVLSPNGHIEHHAYVFHDEARERVWLDTEPGAGAGLIDFLTKMKFFAQVEIADATADWAVLSHTGPTDLSAPDVMPVPGPKFAAGTLPGRPSARYAGRVTAEGGFARRTDALGESTVDMLVPRDRLEETLTGLDLPLAGSWAFDTLRIAARQPRVGVDTDHKTIPHEVPALLSQAVHLDKGCYRGQETVARVHNLGKPPRTLVMLHLDGSDEHPPTPDTAVSAGERAVGRIGTASRHYEDGMIALALLRRNVAENPQAQLLVDGSAAVVDRP